MKKNKLGIMAIIAILAVSFVIVGCGGDDETTKSYTVTFTDGYGTTLKTETVTEGGNATAPANPTVTEKYECKFVAWDKSFTNITANTTVNATWTNYTLGETGPGTGKIFYVDPAGFPVEGYTGTAGTFAGYTAHYLEVAPANSGTSIYSIQWGDYGTLISGVTTFPNILHADASKIGNGRKDTALIVAHLAGLTPPETGRAAQLASASQGGKDDWFLPSGGELNLLYAQKGTIDIVPTTGEFWSSSQSSGDSARDQRFDDGNRFSIYKNNNIDVRAVRAF